MTIFAPMTVKIERNDEGQRPSPRQDPKWSRIDVLRWKAGIIKARTGIDVRFNDEHTAFGPGYSHKWPELIGVLVRGTDGNISSHSELDSTIDTYLRGLEAGALAACKTKER